MAKKLTALDKAIQNIDEQVAALQKARAVIVEQQKLAKPRPKAPATFRAGVPSAGTGAVGGTV